MRTNRRNFLKKAAITAPGIALAGSVEAIPGTGNYIGQKQPVTYRKGNDGWLNANDCGASGSIFKTNAVTKSGSRQITVTDAGDFKVGQGVMVSKCNIRYERTRMWSTGIPYVTHKREVGNSFDVRGYDGSAGSWIVYVLDIAPSPKPAFRWTDDLGRTWHPEVPVTHDWQPLTGGVEVRLNQKDWEAGYVIAFGARDQLISRIEKIEGNVLTLQDEANRSVNDAVVRHNDTLALQEAINRGINEKLNVFVPVGHYMLAESIRIRKANAIKIEGASSVDTILDISEGEGACFTMNEGTEVTIRNFRMLGFMGFDEADKAGELNTRGAIRIWGFDLKHSNGITINNTERVLIENCHASKMSGECFVAGGRSRGTVKAGESYTQWITYRRCSVTNSARNAFNDVYSSIENTSVLNCRIVDVGGCTWEGASRFVKFIGNYVRNAGTVAMGNLGPSNREAGKLTAENRHLMYPELGAGQHIIADNVFEGIKTYGGRNGGPVIRSSRGGTQVIVRNNLFINFNSSGVEVSGTSATNEYPSSNTTITGNIFDLTCVGYKPLARNAIAVGCNDSIVSDNQIYVRGAADPLVTGIILREPALNVNVHDNLIRNCGTGIITEIGIARVGEVIDNKTFSRSANGVGLPIERDKPETVSGWSLAWKTSEAAKSHTDISVIESFDPGTLGFKLREAREMKPGDTFDVIAPSLNWTVHNNTITDCLRPLILNSYGSRTSIFKNNLVTRGNTTNVPLGIEVHGCFQLIDNRITDFDEDKSIVLALYTDPIGRVSKSQYQGNIFENCFNVVNESQPELWKNSLKKDNLALGCVQKIPK